MKTDWFTGRMERWIVFSINMMIVCRYRGLLRISCSLNLSILEVRSF